MRRKSDMWQDMKDESFLPGEGEQAAQAAAADVQDRLTILEDQLRSQFNSMSTYHQIALQAAETARAEARADLDRERATLVSLVERVRTEAVSGSAVVPVGVVAGAAATPAPVTPAEAVTEPAINVSALARIALLEDQFEQLRQQVGLCLRSQEELANSITFMFEQQMRNAGFIANCAEATV